MNKRLSISFVVYRANLSGGVRVIATHARMLRDKGHNVTITALAQQGPTLKSLARHIRQLNCGAFGSNRESHFEANGLTLKLVRKKNRIDAEDLPDADIVIATWWETAEWVGALPPSKGRKFYLIQDHESTFFNLDTKRVEATYSLPLRKIAISKWLQDVMAKEYGDTECLLVQNAVDHEVFAAGARKKSDQPTIGFLYSPAPRKNSALAIEACMALRSRHPDLIGRAFTGNNPLRKDRIPPWIDVAIHPDTERIAEIYAACDVWLFPSKSEGFGLPILEAMACGTPVVATTAGAAPEIVNDDNGGLVTDGSTASFINAADKILSASNEEWAHLSESAFATAQRYDWSHANDALEDAFLQEVAKPGQPKR